MRFVNILSATSSKLMGLKFSGRVVSPLLYNRSSSDSYHCSGGFAPYHIFFIIYSRSFRRGSEYSNVSEDNSPLLLLFFLHSSTISVISLRLGSLKSISQVAAFPIPFSSLSFYIFHDSLSFISSEASLSGSLLSPNSFS